MITKSRHIEASFKNARAVVIDDDAPDGYRLDACEVLSYGYSGSTVLFDNGIVGRVPNDSLSYEVAS